MNDDDGHPYTNYRADEVALKLATLAGEYSGMVLDVACSGGIVGTVAQSRKIAGQLRQLAEDIERIAHQSELQEARERRESAQCMRYVWSNDGFEPA